jgi:hypothetical protein
VALLVAWLAKPHNLKRLVVILMMSEGLDLSASAARLYGQLPTAYGSGNTTVCHVPTGVFRPPCLCDRGSRLDALWLFCTLSVIGAYLFNIFISVGCDIIFVALLAFVNVAVSHL